MLRKQRERLLTFLYVKAVEPTNNQADGPSNGHLRELRPAVIVRKTNGCNRTDPGAHTHSIVTSVLRTCQKQGRDFIAFVADLLRHPDAVAPPKVALRGAIFASPRPTSASP